MKRLILAAALIALTGCQKVVENDPRICTVAPLLADMPEEGRKSSLQKLDECVHRWSYRLARSTDEAETVAKAVLGACELQLHDAVLDWPTPEDRQIKDPTLRSAAIRIAENDGRAFLMEVTPTRALFHVVQARAGKCDVPE